MKNYVGFQGRARRKEYWMFILFNAIFSMIVGIIDYAAGLNSLLTGLYSLIVLLPGLAVAVRRLHDTGKSGWWLLISLIPFVGGIILLVFMCLDSENGENKYGDVPY